MSRKSGDLRCCNAWKLTISTYHPKDHSPTDSVILEGILELWLEGLPGFAGNPLPNHSVNPCQLSGGFTWWDGMDYGDLIGAVQFEKGQKAPESAESLGVREHMSYPVVIKGKGLGLFENPVHVNDIVQTDKTGFAAIRSASVKMSDVTFSIKSKEEADRILGKAHPEFSGDPKAALDFLLEHKEGYVPSAVTVPNVGPIDFIYGAHSQSQGSFGISKIAAIHPESLDALSNLADFKIEKRYPSGVLLKLGNIEALVKEYWFAEKRRWLLTAFEQNREPVGETIDTTNSGETGRTDDKLSAQGSDKNVGQSDQDVNTTFSSPILIPPQASRAGMRSLPRK